ncbi:mycofactocin biosynthesis glycosyltransferase MftF [soil metagenome]
MTRYQLDVSTRTVGDGSVVLGGSPLRLFRLTPAGRDLYDRIAAGDDVERSELVTRMVGGGAIHPLVSRDGPHRFGPADVTVVVPTHETPVAVADELVHSCRGVAGVVFVDDGSSERLTGVRGSSVVRLAHNRGPGPARNTGAMSVTTPLIAFVDSDVEAHSGWLDLLIAHFDDEAVGFVAPRVRSGPALPGGDERVAHYESSHSPLDLGPHPARVVPRTRVAYVPTAAIVVRRDAYTGVGGFDPDLRYGEDVDLVWRLVRAGFQGRYEPGVVIEHAPRRTWRRLGAHRHTYGTSAAALAERHGALVAPVRVSPWSAVVWGLVATGHPVVAAGVAAATAGALVRKLRGVPAALSARLTIRGHVAAGQATFSAMRRAWWPIMVVGTIWSRRVRVLSAVAAAAALADGGPARVFDDGAYGLGVWKGVMKTRRLTALRPEFVGWPPPAESNSVADGTVA